MIKHEVILRKLNAWSDLSDYEGTAEVEYKGRNFYCYTQGYNAKEWKTTQLDSIYLAALEIERTEPIEKVLVSIPPSIRQLDDFIYETTGYIRFKHGDMAQIDSEFPINIDLNIPFDDRQSFDALVIGDYVRITGMLKIDLDSDDEPLGNN